MKKKLILFCLILLLAVFLRIYKLDQYPPSLNWDEVSIGYNAYSILKTGRDEWGQLLPLSFRAYGDYKLPGYVYLDVPFIANFGLNEWGVRLPSALAGIGTVIFIFLIIKKLTKNIHLALWGMFIASTTPWLLILSRVALEANLALFLITSSFYFFLLGLEKNYQLIISSVFLGLSLFTYNSSRVMVLPLIILVLLLFRKKIAINRHSLVSLFLIFVFFLTAIPLALLQDSSARYRWTTILDEGAISRINELRGLSALPQEVERLVFNKITYFAPEVFKNYFSHFNPNFLFFNGGSNYQYSVPGSGLIFILMLPFLILGFWQIFKQKLPWQIFLLGWLLIAPLPAAITRDAPHALRALFLTAPLVVISVLGIDFFKQSLKQNLTRILLIVFVVGIILQTYFFWNNYTEDYIKNYSWSWQYGYREAVGFVKENGEEYDQIFITKKYGEPHEFLLFYLAYNPATYQNNPTMVRYFRSDWYWVDSFDKYQFVNDWEIKESAKCKMQSAKCLLVTSPEKYPKQSILIKTINFLDSKPAFDIVEIK